MARRSMSSNKKEIKNLRLVVKNSINDVIWDKCHAGFNLGEYFIANSFTGARQNSVYAKIQEALEKKLHNSTYDKSELISHLIDFGVNPIDLLFRNIGSGHVGPYGTFEIIPKLESNVSGYKNLPDFDKNKLQEDVVALDKLLAKAVSMPEFSSNYDLKVGFKTNKSRLFAILISGESCLPHMAYSPFVMDLFSDWITELRGMDDTYKFKCVDRILRLFESLAGFSSENNVCPKSFIDEGNKLLFNILDLVSTIKIKPDERDDSYKNELDAFVHFSRFLSLDENSHISIAKKLALTGNINLTIQGFSSLLDNPHSYVKTMKESCIENSIALNTFRWNLIRDVYYGMDKYKDDYSIKLFIDRFSEEFLSAGYSEIKGSPYIDGLAVNLDSAEFFSSIGYLRSEEMCLGSLFTTNHEGKVFNGQEQHHIIERQVACAIKLNQRELLKDAIESYFRNHYAENRCFSTDLAVKLIIESNYFDTSKVLINDLRIKKAIDIGVDPKIVFKNGAGKRVKGQALEDQLGL